MGTSGYGKEKDKGFLKTSLKACDGRLHLQTQMRAVCTESIAAFHILHISETLRWECWQDHNREQPPERIQSSSSSSYLYCLGSHKGGHSASPLPSETLPAPAGLIPGLGRSGHYLGSVSASRKMKAMHSWHHQNYMDLKTLKCWGLRGAGSQMFLKKVRPKVIL